MIKLQSVTVRYSVYDSIKHSALYSVYNSVWTSVWKIVLHCGMIQPL